MTGQTTTTIPITALADEVLVNRDGSTCRQQVGMLAMQLTATDALQGALTAKLDAAALTPIQAAIDALEGAAYEAIPRYASPAAGITGTDEGDLYRVVSTDPAISSYIYRHGTGAVAELIEEVPSVTALVAKADQDAVFRLSPGAAGNPGVLATIEVGDVVIGYVSPAGRVTYLSGDVGPAAAPQSAVMGNPGVAATIEVGGQAIAVVTTAGTLRPLTAFDARDMPAPPSSRILLPHHPGGWSDGMWSYWVSGLLQEMRRVRYGASIGSSPTVDDGRGIISVYQSVRGSAWAQAEVGALVYNQPGGTRTDDHDSPAILLDPRPDAEWPLMIFQAEHSVGALSMWRSRTNSIADLGPRLTLTPADTWTYSQVFRRPLVPDEIWHIARNSGSPFGRWHMRRSTDNGMTWSETQVTSLAWLYIAVRPAADGSGLHALAYLHPNAGSAAQRLTYFHIDWDGRISRADGSVITDNIWSGGLIDPIATGSLILDPDATMRLLDYREVAPGRLAIAIAVYDGAVNPIVGMYLYGDYAPGAAAVWQSVCPCGVGIAVSSPSYVAGAAIAGDGAIVTAVWSGAASRLSLWQGESLGDETVLFDAETKVIRPIVSDVVTWDPTSATVRHTIGTDLAYLVGASRPDDGYSEFHDFNFTTHITSLKGVIINA